MARAEGRWGLSAVVAAARAGADPFACAVVAFEQVHRRHPAIGGSPDSTTPAAKRRKQLHRALDIADRYLEAGGRRGGRVAPGAGIALLCDLLEAGAGEEIVSLAYYGCRLMQLAKRARRVARGLDPITDKIVVQANGYAKPLRSDWYEEREERLGESKARAADRAWRTKRRRGC